MALARWRFSLPVFGEPAATTCSPASFDLVRGLGADVVIDYKSQDFETELSGYDVVLNSQDTAAVKKSLRVLKPGGIVVSISGPPDPAFAKAIGAPWFVGLVMRALSRGVRAQAKRLGVRYSFLFMRADGEQLQKIADPNRVSSGRWSTRSSTSRRPTRRWPTSKPDGQRARS